MNPPAEMPTGEPLSGPAQTGMGGRGRRIPRHRKFALGIALAATLAGLVEAGSFVFFRTFRHRFTFADPSAYVVAPDQLPLLAKAYDPDLGWAPRYGTPHGERPTPRTFRRPWMMAFGDSFTHSDEVSDGETWEVYLAERTGTTVYNFGVGGFGTDQAYLRYRQKAGDLRTDVVSLGFTLESINRVVNVYRKFYWIRTGIPLTKPRFRLENGRLELVRNPLQTAEDIEKLTDPAFVERIGRGDHWYSRASLPVLTFPYAKLLVDPRIWRQALGRRAERETYARPFEDLWQAAPTRALFLAILDAFVADATAAGSRPVLLLFPNRPDVEALIRGRQAPGRTHFLQHCRERAYTCFDGVASFAQALAAAPDRSAYYRVGTHLSPRGNELFARELHDFLRSRQLVPTSG